jgi:hypothetical protein
MMLGVAQRFPEQLGVLEEVGPVLEDGHGLLGLHDVVEESGIFLEDRENGVPEVLFFGLDLLTASLEVACPHQTQKSISRPSPNSQPTN